MAGRAAKSRDPSLPSLGLRGPGRPGHLPEPLSGPPCSLLHSRRTAPAGGQGPRRKEKTPTGTSGRQDNICCPRDAPNCYLTFSCICCPVPKAGGTHTQPAQPPPDPQSTGCAQDGRWAGWAARAPTPTAELSGPRGGPQALLVGHARAWKARTHA